MTSTQTGYPQDGLDAGHRIRLAITLSGLKIPFFARKYKISVSSLYSIESGMKPLTRKMADRISCALLQEGCLCNPEWLLTRKGTPPSLSKKGGLYLVDETEAESVENLLSEDFKIFKEVTFFKSLYPGSEVMGMFDDAMEPFYSPGDFVGGTPQENIKQALNKNCILHLSTGDQLVRRLVKGSAEGVYTLQSVNPLTKTKDPVLYNQTIEKALPIVWHRRKDF